ncbi:FMN-binding protein [Desulfitobacterium sp.]|uniref:FMN-binding protein n=1 Tax=Desulfitobacterium sp. TaxID=49981 RepID=UPI002B1EA2AB|nr:FMN-binding protein [Desulfitobacterium sp.]MEA4901416.1 FMN-binding protein [Desulfitobacterium sp.]
MKKVKAITTVLVLTTALLIGGCGASKTDQAPGTQTPAAASQKVSEVKIYKGVGQTANFRVGPGELFSINYVTASALFDQDGKIIDIYFDALEVMSPNDTEHVGVPKFSGWPGQAAYLTAAANTNETAIKELENWKSKRERGDKNYGLNWSEQINNYQKFMKGKTVAEIEQWFAKYTSDLNGRPLTEKSSKPEDVAKYAKLTADEKKALESDVTSGSTISLKDGHGDYIGALKKAYQNKAEVTVPVK